MEKEYYNISPAEMPARLFSADEIIQASKENMCVFLNCGQGYMIPCRIAAHVHGWCTLVTDRGMIVQSWLEHCTWITDDEYMEAVNARRA